MSQDALKAKLHVRGGAGEAGVRVPETKPPDQAQDQPPSTSGPAVLGKGAREERRKSRIKQESGESPQAKTEKKEHSFPTGCSSSRQTRSPHWSGTHRAAPASTSEGAGTLEHLGMSCSHQQDWQWDRGRLAPDGPSREGKAGQK